MIDDIKKYDMCKVIDTIMYEQDAGMPAVHGQGLMMVALLLFDKMIEMQAGGIELELSLEDLASLVDYSLAINPDNDNAKITLTLHRKPEAAGTLVGN